MEAIGRAILALRIDCSNMLNCQARRFSGRQSSRCPLASDWATCRAVELSPSTSRTSVEPSLPLPCWLSPSSLWALSGLPPSLPWLPWAFRRWLPTAISEWARSTPTFAKPLAAWACASEPYCFVLNCRSPYRSSWPGSGLRRLTWLPPPRWLRWLAGAGSAVSSSMDSVSAMMPKRLREGSWWRSFPSWARLALRASNGSAFRKACECANQSTRPYRRYRRRSYRRRKDSGGGEDANGANLCARRQHGGAGTRHDLVRIDRWAIQFEPGADRQQDDPRWTPGVPDAAVLRSWFDFKVWPAFQGVQGAGCRWAADEIRAGSR